MPDWKQQVKSPTTHKQVGLNSGDAIGLGQISIASQVETGAEIPVSAEVTHSIAAITPLDDDFCTTGIISGGMTVKVQVVVDGQVIGENKTCIDEGLFSPHVAVTAQAPSQAQIYGPVEVILLGGNSGNELDRTTVGNITVTDDPQGGTDCSAIPGYERDPETGECVPKNPDDRCGEGMEWDEDQQQCVEADPGGDGPTVAQVIAGGSILLGTGALAWNAFNNE